MDVMSSSLEKNNTMNSDSESCTHDELSVLDDELSVSEDELSVLDNELSVTTELIRPLSTELRNMCTYQIDQVFEGDISSVPALINSLMDYFSNGLPDPGDKKLYTAHLAAKASFVLKYTWEKGGSGVAILRDNTCNSTLPLYNKLELFGTGILVVTGPLRGIWLGRFVLNAMTGNRLLFPKPFDIQKVAFFLMMLACTFSNCVLDSMKFFLEFMFGFRNESLYQSRNAFIRFGCIRSILSMTSLRKEMYLILLLFDLYI